jgi:deazaflavin-dependent oxidoreductase (nitroreductase family)
MPVQLKEKTRPPRGLARLLFRLPIWFYRIHLGWLFGYRFMLLTHTGRKSGLPRQAFVEVLEYDRSGDTCIVFAGWGKQSDWVRNIEKDPQVFVNIGHKRFPAYATRLEPEAAERAIVAYARRNPLAMRVIPRLMGYRLDGTAGDFHALARMSIVYAFRPGASPGECKKEEPRPNYY